MTAGLLGLCELRPLISECLLVRWEPASPRQEDLPVIADPYK